MKQRPILMHTQMAIAASKDIKTQTRRIMALQRELNDDEYLKLWVDDNGELHAVPHWKSNDLPVVPSISLKCPYGKPGDILWVREEHYRWGQWEYSHGVTKSGKIKSRFVPLDTDIVYGDGRQIQVLGETFTLDVKPNSYRLPAWYKRLARFMPKSAARTILQITDVRIERLQEISEEDAKAEGVEFPSQLIANNPKSLSVAYRIGFIELWKFIYGAGSWESNPWVWVISFKRVNNLCQSSDHPCRQQEIF
jgi:hypothetical protein